ncbi:MAG: hypothetical protein KTQ49_08825, partial [Candidatus Omnitrophica bacterium]|nr:hypothetical protein [Candidatus Omnitrophota bacterium]
DYHAEALFRRLEDQRETESPVIAVPDVDPNTYSGSEGVTLGDNYVLVNWNTLRYIVALRSKPWTIKRICDLDDQDLLKKPDFIVCHGDLEKMGVPGPLSASYRLTDIFVMPDESRVHLYKLGSPGAAGREEVVVHRAGNRFMLDNGLLQLDRGNNRWRLFWKGKMVVQKLVVIAADDPFRIWNDSERCRWKILSRSKDRLVARASSSFFHPDQEWEFVLDGHRLYWTVKVYERFYRRSDWEEVRVHLSEKYCRWRTDVGSGDFPQRAVESRKETWWPLAKGGPFDTAFVGVERVEEELPSVTFFSLRSREGLKGEVGGTEGCFSSKVLQYVLREPWRLGRFRGCLVLEDGVQAA